MNPRKVVQMPRHRKPIKARPIGPIAYRPAYGRDRPLRLTSRAIFALITAILAGIGLHIVWEVIQGALQ